MKFVLKHLELILSAAGLLVIFLMPALFHTPSADYWRVVALTAIGVGVLHGVIFWTVRRRQQMVREQAVAEITLMLQDRINNVLSRISLHASYSPDEEAQRTAQLKGIQDAVDNISRQLKEVSDESLSQWKHRYTQAHADLQHSA